MIARLKELLFQNRSIKQTIAKNIFWLSIGEVASRFIRGIIVIYAARILGAAEFGIFSYALGLAGLFTIFSDMGIIMVLTRELTQRPNDSKRYLATAFVIKISLLISTSLAIAFLAPLFSLKTAIKLLPIMAALTFFDGIRDFSLGIFRAIEKMELQAFVTFFTNVAIVGSALIALWYYGTSTSLAITYVVGTGAGALVAMFILRKEYLAIWQNFDKTLIKKILGYSWPLFFMGMFSTFMLNTDNVLLGYFKGEEYVGLYAAAQKIIQILYILPAIIAIAIFPPISRLVAQNEKEKIRSLIEKGLTMVFMIAIPITLGGIILAKPITFLLYKAEYLSSVSTLQILLLTVLIIFPGTIIGNLGLAYNRQKDFAKFIGIAALANAIGDAILIPIFGMAGSAVVTVTAQFISNGFQWRLLKKINNFYILRHLKKIVVSSLAMGIICVTLNFLEINVIANIGISALIYFAILYIIKESTLKELIGMMKFVRASQ